MLECNLKLFEHMKMMLEWNLKLFEHMKMMLEWNLKLFEHMKMMLEWNLKLFEHMKMMLEWNLKLFGRVLLFANASKSTLISTHGARLCVVAQGLYIAIIMCICGLERTSKHILPTT